MAEPYPPFRGWSDTYPVDIAPEEPPAAQSRLTVGFRIFLALPALLLASVLFLTVLPIVAIIGWFAALAVARMPKGLQGLGAYCIRYTAQTAAYVLLITDRYPSLASGSPYQFEEAHDVGSPGRQS